MTKNFTVIGNILFIHAKIKDDSYNVGDVLITIPPAIFSRMLTYNQSAFVTSKLVGGTGYGVGVTCNNNGEMVARNSFGKTPVSPRFVVTWYVLKDI